MNKNKNPYQSVPQPVSLITIYDSHSVASEQYRTLRSNIKFSIDNDRFQTMLVTSSTPGEGKSTTAANLAVVFADLGSKTLLVDADLRKPTVSLTFKLPNNRGLSHLLRSRSNKAADFIQSSGVDCLDILTSGPLPSNPAEMLSSRRMSRLLEDLKNTYDMIIFDTPPLTSVTDAQVLASQIDGVVLVAREDVTPKQALVKSKELLQLANATILGVVYNATDQVGHEGYYGYGGYH